MPTSERDFKALLQALSSAARDAASQFGNSGSAIDPVAARGKIMDVVRAYDAVSGAAPDPSGTEFSEFFAEIGRSVVRAQRDLDQASKDYVASVSGGKGLISPATFRIPRVSAKMQFEFSTEKSRGFNLIFSKTDSSKTTNQQQIEFEIASTPPPPELINAIRSGVPRLEFVLSPQMRARVFKALENTTPGSVDVSELLNLSAEDRRKVLMLPWVSPASGADAAPGAAAGERYFLIYADDAPDAEDHTLGVWCLVITSEGNTVTWPWKYDVKPLKTEDVASFKTFIVEIQNAQAAFLASVGG